MARPFSIFHFPFIIYHIYHLSSGDARSPAHVKRQQRNVNSATPARLPRWGHRSVSKPLSSEKDCTGQQMTTDKCQMTNGKWIQKDLTQSQQLAVCKRSTDYS